MLLRAVYSYAVATTFSDDKLGSWHNSIHHPEMDNNP